MRFQRLIVGLTVALLAACGGSDDDDADSAEAASDTTTTSPAVSETDAVATSGEPSATTTAPAGDPTAVLRFQFGTPAGSNYDPATANNQFVNIYLYPAYDRLVDLSPDGELEPMLAESWEFLDDGLTLRLSLRDGVVFHDGTPFDAEAVKANIERGQTLDTSAIKPDLAAVSEVVVVDATTVDLKLSAPSASLPALLADRAGMMVSPAAFANADLDLRPVGTGPYQVKDHQPGTVISYEPFAQYWDPAAQTLGGLEISIQLDPEARLRALTDGQIDGTLLNPDQLEAAEGGGVTAEVTPSLGSFLLYLNKSKPGLDDVRVRRAISYAIDREGIAAALQAGRCTPSSQLFPSDYWAADESVAADPYDPEAARSLLEEAGHGDGLSLSAVVVNVPFYTAQLEAIQAQLAEVGIDLAVTSLEPTELISRFVGGEADMYFSQWPGATDPAKTVANLLGAQSTLNPGGYTNADIDRLAAEGLGVLDQSERAPIYHELSKAMVDDEFHIVLCSAQNVYAQTPSVSNLTPALGASLDFRGVTVSA